MLRKTDPETIAPYLKDASNFSGGRAQEVVIPENREELAEFLKANDEPITVAGAGTGLTASRIPLDGIVISLERFRRLGPVTAGSIAVGPAVTLQNLNDFLAGSGWFYPPNPTEWLASVGGTLATNASGSRSYKFGATRAFVLEAEVVLGDGRSVVLRRGQTVNHPLVMCDGSRIEFPAVRYLSPDCKNAAGYFVRPGMDWLDLFIGSEGTLGVFTGCRLQLLPAPAEFLSGVLFMEEEESCWHLLKHIRESSQEFISPCSLEYFDSRSLQRLRSKFSGIPESAQAALFFEQDVARKEDYDRTLEAWYDFLEGETVLLDNSWFAQSLKDVERFHEFRHALPLMINEENSRLGRVKMGTDLAAGNDHFLDMMQMYRDQLTTTDIDYAMFGHIGDNHLHINLLPKPDQVDHARQVYAKLVDQVLKWGGTVSAEHGIGKLKKEYFSRMVGAEGLEELKKIKKALDPLNRLGRSNLF